MTIMMSGEVQVIEFVDRDSDGNIAAALQMYRFVRKHKIKREDIIHIGYNRRVYREDSHVLTILLVYQGMDSGYDPATSTKTDTS